MSILFSEKNKRSAIDLLFLLVLPIECKKGMDTPSRVQMLAFKNSLH